MQQQLDTFLQEGITSSAEPLSEFIRLAVQGMVQQVLKQEVTGYLGRERYERQPEVSGYRNGYKPSRIHSAEGEIRFEVPQVRDSSAPYRSKLLAFLRGNSDVLEYLVTQMYSRGLSTRDVEDAFRDPYTGELLLSRTAVSEITDSLWEDYQLFCQRDLGDFEVEYLFLDAVYESLRRIGSVKEALLCAWGICRDGRKVLLHLALGNKESTSAWREFIRDMQRRGLPTPTLVVSDGAPAAIAAIEELYCNRRMRSTAKATVCTSRPVSAHRRRATRLRLHCCPRSGSTSTDRKKTASAIWNDCKPLIHHHRLLSAAEAAGKDTLPSFRYIDPPIKRCYAFLAQ